jgi:mono/diheme cytochrome c family protein
MLWFVYRKEDVVKFLWTVVVVIILLVVVAAWVILSGTIDVSAWHAKSGFVDGLLEAAQEHSVEAHAARIRDFDLSGASVPVGAAHYREMCIACHGGPGSSRTEIGQGLFPPPPDLTESAHDLKPREIYWIVKNGIRMTGMPAFGSTHDQDELRGIAAFVLRLPGMSAGEFQALADAGEEQDPMGNEPDRSLEMPPQPDSAP